MMVDTMGLIVGVIALAANVQDRDGAKKLIKKIRFDSSRMQIVWADGAYSGALVEWVREFTGWTLVIVKRSDKAQGFEKLPHRWIVERTFAWLVRYRRLTKDYEFHPQSGIAYIHIAMINLMLHRLSPEAKNHNYRPRNRAIAA